eukprot:g2800.t1
MVVGITARSLWRIGKGYVNKIKIPIQPKQPMITKHRVLPGDCDLFLHMNNASYFRISELARWELLASTGLLNEAIRENYIFLVVDQTGYYYRPLPMFPLFKEFDLITTVDRRHWDEWGDDENEVTGEMTTGKDSDKYMYFTHDFYYKGDKKCASMKVKAIIKKGGNGPDKGKTIRPSQLTKYFTLK